MNIILLSGGSGKRLWPLSNEVRSKQFLKLIEKDSGSYESMLQRVHGQITSANLSENITIATSAAQVQSIKSQLGEKVSVVVEPERRNTFPAIALSCACLYLEKNIPLDETIAVLPVDPYVELGYFETIRRLDEIVQKDISRMALMGVTPTYPAEKYGYIIPESPDEDIMKVKSFKEKPDKEAAQSFIDMGGLWNCGVFAFKLGYIIEILKKHIEFTCYNDILKQYSKLEKTSFDYAVVEKEKSVSCVSYSGEWKDLGTWNTLAEVMDEKPIGDVRQSECENTHMINELDIPLVVMGAKDMIVVASPDGVLVADKNQSSFIKKHVDEFDKRPMFEEREWGEYKVLDYTINHNGDKTLTKKKFVKAGAEIVYEAHHDHAEVLTVLSGSCIIRINNRSHEAFAGDTYQIPVGVGHGLKAVSDVLFIEVQVTSYADA